MQLQGNWENHGLFYSGRLNTQEPMTMHYNDGDIEQLALKQIRGARPGETVLWKKAAGRVAAGAAVGLAIYAMHKKRAGSKP